jgi:transglutaminase-like putative cysteine protease
MASSAASPGTSLPADRFYRTALFFLVLSSVLALVATGKLDAISNIVAPLLILFKGIRWWRGYPAELRQTTATRFILAYMLIIPADLLFFSRSLAEGNGNPTIYAALLAAVHFLLFVMVLRLYSAVTDRDAIFLAMLAFAALLAAAVFTVDTHFLFFFLAFLLFAVATFVGLEIRRGAAGAVFPPLQARSAAESRFHRALALAVLSVALGGVAFGSLLFFFFPRFSAGYLARGGFQPSLMSGFTDNVELGQIGQIKQNTSVVMRVRTGSPVNYPMLRWRGIALSNFDGKRWSNSEPNRKIQSPAQDGWINLASRKDFEAPRATEIQFTILLQPIASDALFAPAQVVRLRGNFLSEATTYYSSVRNSVLLLDSTGSIFNTSHSFSQIRYEGLSILPQSRPAQARSAGSVYPQEIRDTYLQLPQALDPRIPEFAKRITAAARNPFDKAVAMESYLRDNFTYTLNLTAKPGADPLAHFLFETRAGHCEYFASGMAIMLRTLGIPSREVNGFLPGEFNDVAGDYIVRASDAHSWVEAYFPGSGWVTFDPTPAAAGDAAGLFSRMALYFDWFQLNWNEWVINYDFSHQVQLARNVRQGSTDWAGITRRKFERMKRRGMNGLTGWQAAHPWLSIVFPIALVCALVVLRFDWIRAALRWATLSWQVRHAPAERTNPQLASRLYAELLRLLEKRGLARPITQTPLEFATSCRLQSELASPLLEFTELYAQARFGDKPCDSFRLHALLEQIRAVPRSC